MNGRVVLVGLAVAVLGAAAYFLFMRGGDDNDRTEHGAADDPAPERDIPESPVRGGAPERDHGKVLAADERPSDPVVQVREDGSSVRDHRQNPTEYIRPSLPHPENSPVAAEVTASVMKLIRPVVLGCMKDVPASAFGEKPVVMTRATISIDDQGLMRVDDIGPALSDIDEAAAATALDCIRAKSGSLTEKVDHAAVASANLAFPIRPLDYRRDKPPSK